MLNLPAGTYKLSIYENGLPSVRNENGDLVYCKNSNGYEVWNEYDDNGNLIHSKNSNGNEYENEYWFNTNGYEITKEEFDRIHAPCAGKVIKVEGKKYRLTTI